MSLIIGVYIIFQTDNCSGLLAKNLNFFGWCHVNLEKTIFDYCLQHAIEAFVNFQRIGLSLFMTIFPIAIPVEKLNLM